MTDKSYMDDVATLMAQIERRGKIENPIVLYGSSSFNYWHRMAEDLGSLSLINAGFGGGTYQGAFEHYSRVLKPLNPGQILIYFGENDIAADGNTAAQIFAQQQKFHQMLRADFPKTNIIYLGIKTGPSRWLWHNEYSKYNSLLATSLESDPQAQYLDIMSCLMGDNGLPMQKYFENDGIHVTPLGYALWVPILREALTI
ncbi:MAG: lysophospholipase [OCS116 cluster bacterium]|uniref:Lysophospholipase n=1 Tax=OCS116 cluster bacterium TaxID=2030921 RepID=A0A2A4Z9X1_9PROT|nr:lysophospholipase [OCS116 cluster bacterium]